jgi:nuclear transport factor 2 (NTF2) superfamily protein
MSRPPLPPFTAETAAEKARMAEDAWNTRDPAKVSLAYTPDSRWRPRPRSYRGVPHAQMEPRARLSPHQGGLDLPGKPHCRALCL